jgi:MFS transporter, DHA1 family, purine base/nucleoside efflux pump
VRSRPGYLRPGRHRGCCSGRPTGSGTEAAALACYGVGALAGNLAGGRLTDRLGASLARLAALAALTVALAVLAAALHGGAAPVLPALALLGLAAYPFFTAQQTRLATVFPAASGSILAWNNSAMYAGILAGSALGGLLLHASSPTVLVLAAILVALLACLIAASSLIIRSDGGFRLAASRAAHRRDGG